MIIFKKFSFDAAHYLPNVPDGHKCKNMHGHTYKLIIEVSGSINENTGWVIDFEVISNLYKAKIKSVLDHKLLNEIPGLENPTAENIAKWIWTKLKPELVGLNKITLFETDSCGVVYTEDHK